MFAVKLSKLTAAVIAAIQMSAVFACNLLGFIFLMLPNGFLNINLKLLNFCFYPNSVSIFQNLVFCYIVVLQFC